MYSQLVSRALVRYDRWRYQSYRKNAISPALFQDEGNMHELLGVEGYVSQEGQDKWVYENLFNRKNHGVFVDIGAHDGVHFSNTLFLERAGWTGLLVEPNPSVFQQLIGSRKAAAVNACISCVNGSVTYRKIQGYAEMLSGIVEHYDDRHIARIEKTIAEHGGGFQDIPVRSVSLDRLLDEYMLTKVDYMNIDVEGAELDILKTIDFDQTEIAVIGVENNYSNYRIPSFLKKHGYMMHSVVGDEFYIRS